MPQALLQEMDEELTICERAHARAVAQETACIAAGLEVEALAGRILRTSPHLDALNTLRFVDDPVLRDEWARAAAIPWPSRRQRTPPTMESLPAPSA